MATWNSGALWSSGILWGPASPPPPLVQDSQIPKHHKNMKREHYYPRLLADQPEWHFNYAEVLEDEGVGIGLELAKVTASVNDSRHLGYALGAWRTYVRDFGPGATGQIEVLRYGTGGLPFELPAFAPPAPPAGLTPVLAGALTRIFKFVRTIKAASGYTDGLGLLMGIVGSEEPPPPPPGDVPPPRIIITVIAGDTFQKVRLKFFKDGHEYVEFQSRRGAGDWETLGQSKKSPFLDERPLLSPTQAEIREYRARFLDDNQPTSEWCAVEKATVSP